MPTARNVAPITGTLRTENAPPAITADPYMASHVPGNASYNPALANTRVKAAPVTIGGVKPSTNFRPGPRSSDSRAARSFQAIDMAAIAIATPASMNQIVTHTRTSVSAAANHAAASAVSPIATPPQPGTAVNDAAFAIVSRMNRRLSIARS